MFRSNKKKTISKLAWYYWISNTMVDTSKSGHWYLWRSQRLNNVVWTTTNKYISVKRKQSNDKPWNSSFFAYWPLLEIHVFLYQNSGKPPGITTIFTLPSGIFHWFPQQWVTNSKTFWLSLSSVKKKSKNQF